MLACALRCSGTIEQQVQVGTCFHLCIPRRSKSLGLDPLTESWQDLGIPPPEPPKLDLSAPLSAAAERSFATAAARLLDRTPNLAETRAWTTGPEYY